MFVHDEKYKIIRIGGHEIDDEGKIDVLIVHWSNLLKPTREKFRTSDWENNEVFKTYYVNICFYFALVLNLLLLGRTLFLGKKKFHKNVKCYAGKRF